MEYLRFGIVGCGNIAVLHAKAIRNSSRGKLVAVADGNIERARSFADEYGVAAFSSLSAMLDGIALDVVCICTPSGFHVSCALEAMAAGKHVLIEKPVAMTVEDCDRMIALRDEKGVCAGAICQYRFVPVIQLAKKLVDEGKLGKIITTNLSMLYHRSPEYYQSAGWRGTWALDGGSLMNQGIHGADALVYILGDPAYVSGVTRTLLHNVEAEDTAVATVEFKNGALAVIQSTTAVTPGYPRTMTISGTKGSLRIQEEELISCDIEGYEPPELHKAEKKNLGYNKPMEIGFEGHLHHIEDFMDAITSNKAPAVTLEDARRTISLITSVRKSSEQGQPIHLTV